MQCQKYTASRSPHLVGDPVDVITGASTDFVLDFELEGPQYFPWRRHYDSSRAGRRLPLGRGHNHDFDRWLCFDNDGLRYLGPDGTEIGFPALREDGDEASTEGYHLTRFEPFRYRLRDPAGWSAEFRFRTASARAPIRRLTKGDQLLAFEHDGEDRLLRIRDGAGRMVLITTLETGLIESLELERTGDEPNRLLIRYQYDEDGRLMKAVDGYGGTLEFEYDRDHRLIRRVDRRGYAFLFDYDGEGRCIRARGEDGLHEVRLRYLSAEHATVVTRGDGGEWTYLYDDNGGLSQIIEPYGAVREFIRDESGRLLEERDANGCTTRVVYGATGGESHRVDEAGRLVSDEEEEEGRARPDPREHRIPDNAQEWMFGDLFPIDRSGLPTFADPLLYKVPPPLREFVQRKPPPEYQPGGFVPPEEGMHGANGGPGPVYDVQGRLIRELNGAGESRRYGYDPNGNLARYRDFEGNRTKQEHSGWNQLVRVTDSLGRSVEYTYTSSEQVRSVTDPGGAISEYEYDLKDRLVTIRRHGTIREQYRYDDADNLIEKLDGNSNTILTLEYGRCGLRTARHLASGESHYFDYDDAGRLTGATGESGKITFAYDRGKRIEDLRDGQGVRHAFDNLGRLTQTVVLDRFKTAYRRPKGNTVEITDPTGGTHVLRRLGHGVVLRTLSNGSQELMQFDASGRCLMAAASLVRDPLPWARAYQYSGEGDLTVVSDTIGGTRRFRYDPARRPIECRHPDGRTDTFEYDAGDNLRKQPDLRNVGIMEGNRLVEANGHRYEYNERNQVARRTGPGGVTSYSYDSRDLLDSIEAGEDLWRVAYDPLGRRVWKETEQGRTEFFWNSDQLVAERDPEGRLRVYIYADPLAATPLLFIDYEGVDASPETGNPFFVYVNQVGCPVLVEDAKGTVVWRAHIHPFGKAVVEPVAAVTLNLRFPGHYLDPETGLHYNRFRYYDPTLGRYLQPDPLGVEGGANLYAAPRNPLVSVDVRGEMACPACEAKKKKTDEEGLEHEDLPKPSEIPVSKRKPGSEPFDDVKNMKGKNVKDVREELESKGFHQTQHERTVKAKRHDAEGNELGDAVKTDSQGGSEIWMRKSKNEDGGNDYEAVRIDQHGHERSDRVEKGEPFAGEEGHVHKEHIPDDPDRRANAKDRDGNPIFPDADNTTNDDVADRYNEKFTPGVQDNYNDGSEKVSPPGRGASEAEWTKYHKETHTSVEGIVE